MLGVIFLVLKLTT
jgi:hypothetical protein